MTEEEAKTKWCPKSMTSLVEECRDGVAAYVFNRMATPKNPIPEECCCIASDCMWWVWDSEITSKTQGHCGAVK